MEVSSAGTSRFAYDGDGLLLRAENAEIKVAFKRDAAERVIKEMQGGQDIVRPNGKEVSFAYDALGRRIRKSFSGATTHFVWDGNVPLHEWSETVESEENVITWLFEQDTFVPAAKLVANGECFSIISNYLGTPLQAYDKKGNKVWEQELDIYGRQRKRPSAFIPFKYQGQYEDVETGLYDNHFHYHNPNAGSYVSQDPIGCWYITLHRMGMPKK